MRLFFALFLLLQASALSAQTDCSSVPQSDGKVYSWCYQADYGTNWDTRDYRPFIINGMRFRLLFPTDYNQADAKTYPLVVFLHGLGQHGTDNNLQLKIGGINHLKGVQEGKYNGFIMVPQADSERWAGYEKDKVLAFVEYAISHFKVDPLRVTAEGYSAGADMAWKLTTENPKVFASVAIMSYARATTAEADAQLLRYKAVWHSQGGRDTGPSPSAGNAVAEAFRTAGANYYYYFYPELGHGTWWASYVDKAFFPFLQNSSMLNIHARYFKYNFCEGEKVEGIMGIQAGFEDYEWKRDGQLLDQRTHEIPFSQLGSYTVRLKRKGQWSNWSEPLKVQRVGPSPKPVITAGGPTALPTPDGRSTVTLYAPKKMQAYLWSTGATTDSIVVDQAGSYSVSVTQPYGCPSSYSDPVKVSYNAQGTLISPTNLRVLPLSVNSTKIFWQDNSNNESGFELYRSTGAQGPWELAGQLPVNSKQTTDNNLLPNTRYYYQLRAVNNSGGSEYARAQGYTYADTQPPGRPQGLSIGHTTSQSIALYWQPSTDGTSRPDDLVYELYANDSFLVATTQQTQYTLKGLPAKQWFRFKVRARDSQGNLSEFSRQLSGGTFLNGLFYTYYEGEISTVNDISLLDPVSRGYISNFSIEPRQLADTFAFTYEGSLRVPSNGVYTFYTRSKDGSILSLDGRQLVFNDYTHEAQERSGTIELRAGIHPLKLAYFEGFGEGEVVEVRWKGPGFDLQPIADSLFTEPNPGREPAAVPRQVSLSQAGPQQVKISWLSPENHSVEIYRGQPGGQELELIASISAGQDYLDEQVEPLKTYQYGLRAVSSLGESALLTIDEAGSPLQISLDASGGLAPDKLSAVKTPEGYVLIRWNNRTVKPEGFEVWRRIGNQAEQRVGLTAADVYQYAEVAPGSGSPVYYRVRAKVGGQPSAWSPEVQLDVNRQAPQLSGIPATLRVSEGDTSRISFSVTHPDGQAIGLSVQSAPAFLQLSQPTTGQAELLLSPTVNDIGLYPNLQLTASDSLLTTFFTFNLQVVHRRLLTTYINFGEGSVPQPWNTTERISSQNSGRVLSNMLNEFGEETGYYLQLESDGHSIEAWGASAGPENARFPTGVSRYAYRVRPGAVGKITLGGLDKDKKYNLVFYGSSIFRSFNGETLYRVGGKEVRLAVQSNINQTVQLNGLSPSAQGTLELEVEAGANATKGGFLNALLLEEYTPSSEMLSPSNLQAWATSVDQIELNWEDKSEGEQGFEVWQRRLPSGEFQLVNTTAANTTSYVAKGLIPDTGYEFKIRAKQAGGYSGFSKTKTAASLLRELFINANFTLNMADPWNNLDRKPVTGDVWYNFHDQDNLNTAINLRVLSNFDGDNPFGPEAAGRGIYPDNVLKTFYYTEVGTKARLQFYGLDDALRYSFRFMAASAFPGGESGVTTYTIGNQRVSLDAEQNISTTASIYSVQPQEGKITLEIEAGEFARYGFLTAMEVEIYDPAREEIQPDLNQLLSSLPQPESGDVLSSLSLYPNPTASNLTVALVSPASGAYTVMLTDAAGRQVLRLEKNLPQGNTNFTLELSGGNFKPGLYLIRVVGPNYRSKVGRFIMLD